jgi:hypothetical protein
MLSSNTIASNTALASLYCINKFTLESEGEMIMVSGSLVLLWKENSRAILSEAATSEQNYEPCYILYPFLPLLAVWSRLDPELV